MASRDPSIRRALSVAMVVVAVLALLVSASLVALTVLFDRNASTLQDAITSVHLAEEAEVDLLVLPRARDPLVRAQLAEGISQRLEEARAHAVSGGAEARILEATQVAIREYVASGDAESLDAAYYQLEELVDINLAQAQESEERAERWSVWGSVLGIAVAVLIMATAALAIWWVRTRALRPVARLAEVMDEFGRGYVGARAPEAGAIEIQVMARHFNALADTLLEQREAQATFLASVAHDLRNPLSVLRLTAEALPPDRPLPDEAVVRKMVQRVQRQVSRLERMTRDFEDRARIEAGDLRVEPHRHDAREVARAVAELFDGVSAAHPIEVACPLRPVWVECDPVRMEQVLTNLVSNAIKYSPGGGRIDIEVAPAPDDCVLAVSDHGVGLAQDEIAGIFAPYRRGETLRDEVPGAGLGLANVRRIVEAHKGHIEVRSVPGQGTRFEVHLPAAQAW
jgi:signal transduction histidine kinase